MAEESQPKKGYQCEFIDPVPGHLKCHKCKMVARNLVFVNCCMESYCSGCISERESCHACNASKFSTVDGKKHLKSIQELKVYCSMKSRGCDWSGTVEEWETHIDPNLDNCQYSDVPCPLDCDKMIPKNLIVQHMADECAKREYTCEYCDFKGTYEEVMNVHLRECKYVPVQCPNFCNVSDIKREQLWQHIKICSREELLCKFSGVGCEDRFWRKDEAEHMNQNSQSHLLKTATTLATVNKELRQKLLQQEETIKTQGAILSEQEEKIALQQSTLDNHNNRLEELEDKLFKQVDDYQINLRHQKHKEKQYDSLLPPDMPQESNTECSASPPKQRADTLTLSMSERKEFVLQDFSKIKRDELDWKSVPMYTSASGYKFCIGIDANGRYNYRGKAMRVEVNIMKGEFDDSLEWPRSAEFTIELINQQGGPNLEYTSKKMTLRRTASDFSYVGSFQRVLYDGYYGFLEHSQLKDYLINDELHFRISKVEFP